ncbi:uncharacterized protein [Manis javanica]|uniref:uncharacterized protein isoform X2 n=1 Tax=Manis javanica TaxID=9974 RepID=UPI003C6D29A6
MNLHQVLTGAVNPGDRCFSVGSGGDQRFNGKEKQRKKISIPATDQMGLKQHQEREREAAERKKTRGTWEAQERRAMKSRISAMNSGTW